MDSGRGAGQLPGGCGLQASPLNLTFTGLIEFDQPLKDLHD